MVSVSFSLFTPFVVLYIALNDVVAVSATIESLSLVFYLGFCFSLSRFSSGVPGRKRRVARGRWGFQSGFVFCFFWCSVWELVPMSEENCRGGFDPPGAARSSRLLVCFLFGLRFSTTNASWSRSRAEGR